MIRKLLHRVVLAIAGVVYEAGVKLYRLSDRLDGWDGTCEEPQPQTFYVSPPTVTWSGTNTVHYTINDGTSLPPNIS